MGYRMKFKELNIGDTFDFIDYDHPEWNSFFERCTKISARKYDAVTISGLEVGTINVNVFHVTRKKK